MSCSELSNICQYLGTESKGKRLIDGQRQNHSHYSEVKTAASQIAGVSIICSTVCSGADQRKHQSLASLALVRGIQRWPVDSHHRGPVTRKMLPFDYVIVYKKKSGFCHGVNRLNYDPDYNTRSMNHWIKSELVDRNYGLCLVGSYGASQSANCEWFSSINMVLNRGNS